MVHKIICIKDGLYNKSHIFLLDHETSGLSSAISMLLFKIILTLDRNEMKGMHQRWKYYENMKCTAFLNSDKKLLHHYENNLPYFFYPGMHDVPCTCILDN